MQVDSTPPAASIDLKHDAPNDTGASSTDGVTANPHPVLVGTGEPNSNVTVTVTPAGGTPVTYSVPTDANGNWSVDTNTVTPISGSIPSAGLPDGPVALQVVSIDGAGNTTTATGSFTEDHTPPVASIDLKHDTPDDTGSSSTDGITGNPHPLIIGTGEPSSPVTVTVTPNGGAPVTYTAPDRCRAATGPVDTNTAVPTSGTLPPGGLPDGPVGLQVVSTDAAGNSTPATGSFVEDHTAPTAPTISLKHDAADDTGVSATDNLTSNATPVLVGTAEANSTVSVTVTPNGSSPITYTAATDDGGNWTIDTAHATPTSGTMPTGGLPDGNVGLSVVATDAAGNVSQPGTSAFLEDHTAPTAPTISLKHDAADDTGVSATDNITGNTKPTLVGTAEANSTVTITVTPASGGAVTYTTTTDGSGNWTINTATAAPTSGALPAGGLPDGNVGLSVVATDAAGNVSQPGTSAFLEDHTAPTAPTIGLKHDAADDTGVSATDNITGNTKPILVGTAEANSTVTITVTPASGGAVTYTTTTDGSGNWTINTATAAPTSGALPAGGLPDGNVGLSVVATDAAGNASQPGTSAFLEDHTTPTVPTISLKHDAADDTGVSATDNITANTKPILVGTAEANSTLNVTVTPNGGSPITYTATTDGAGNWTIDTAHATPTSGTMPASGLPDGNIGLSVVATDAAGNVSQPGTGAFVEDHTAPAAPTISLKHDAADDTGVSATDNITGNTAPILVGTAEANSTVNVTVTPAGGSPITYVATTDASGNWAIDTSTAAPATGAMPAGGLPDGVVGLTVVSTDAAGNASTPGTSAFLEDHTTPGVPTIGLKHDAVDDTGASATDSITSNFKPVIVGTAEASTAVTLTVTPNGSAPITYTTTTDASGNWSIDTATAAPASGAMPAGGLPDGAVGLEVVATNAVGNNSTPGFGSFVEDHTIGTPTIGLKHDAADDTGVSATDNITGNVKPILVGTAEANTTVTITVTPASGTAFSYTTTTDGTGNWTINTATAATSSGTMPAAGLPDGNVGLSVVATDAAGNVSQPGTSAFLEDHTAPTVPTISLKHDAADDTGASATDNITGNVKPILVGTAEANSTVTITVTPASGAPFSYTTTTDGTGNWTINTATAATSSGTMPAGGLPDGNVGLSVVATDAAGNVSQPGTSAFLEDHTAPTAPTISLKHDAADDTGVSATDNITANTKPILVGTADANTAVTITVVDHAGNTIIYKTTTDASGNWSIDTAHATAASGSIGSGLAEGSVSLSVVATDTAGNNSATGTSAFVEDLTPPTTATISLKHDAADDTGVSATDNITGNVKPILVGTAEANSTVTITVTPTSGAPFSYATTTDGTGNWTINTATAATSSGTMPAGGLPDGNVGLSVVATDAAGNVSQPGTSAFLEDHTAPTVPTISLKHDAADDTGVSSTDNITGNTKPILVGTAEANSTVTITVTPTSGAPFSYTTTTDGTGNWTINTATAATASGTMPAGGMPEGNVGLSVVATDASGNVSQPGTSAFLEDHSAPGAPTISLKHDAVDDTGVSSTDSITSNVRPVLVGTAEASTTVTITVTPSSGAPLTYTTTTDTNGNWTIDTATAAPTSGAMPAGGLPDGNVGLQVVATNAVGNNSAPGLSAFLEEHTAPAIPTISLKHDAADDTGVSSTDNITGNVKPILVGTAEANSTVAITVTPVSGTPITYTTTTDGTGNWTIDTASAVPTSGALPAGGLPDGNVGLSVVATDAAGNVSQPGTSAFLEDHAAPTVPTISLKHDAADDTGVSTTDNITGNTKPILVGTAEANSTVTITVTPASGTPFSYTTITDGTGNWTINTATAATASGTIPAAGLPDGNVGLSVVATDAAGNVSQPGSSAFLEDHTAPTVPTISLKHDAADDTGVSATDNITGNVKPILVGTAEANSTVTITVTPASGTPFSYTTTTDSTGNWTINTATAATSSGTMPTGGLPDGNVGLSVVATDAAGNVSQPGTSAFLEDHTAPTAPTISLKHDAADDTGVSATDNITGNTKPTLVGTAEANSTVTITVTPASGGAVTYTTTTDGSGNWTINTATAAPTSGALPAGGLPDGNVGLSVVATDAAGNVSQPGSSTFLEDHTAPTVPTVSLKHDATDDTGISSTDNITGNTKPVLVGTAEANSTVTITVTPASGAPFSYTTTTNGTGNWTINTASAATSSGTMPAGGLPDGNVGLSVVATDAAGNVSQPGTSAFLEDHTAPTAPTISLKHDAADDTGVSATDNITANTKPILVGTADANTAVTITVVDHAGNTIIYKTTTDASGNWSIDTAHATAASGSIGSGLAEGSVSLSVVATDTAGNNSATGTSAFVEDLTPPTTATISLKHDAADDTGTSATDNLTNNVKPILVGTSDPNTAVTITVKDATGNTFSYNTTTDASGNWSIDTSKVTANTGSIGSGLAEGVVSLTIVASDLAGNLATGTSSFTEDLTKPTAAISLKHDAANDTGVSSTDGLTSNAEPVLVGTGEKNSTVQVTVVDAKNDTLTYSAVTDSNGNWSIDTSAQAPVSGTMPRDGLSNGLVNLSVTSVDAAGNSATATNTFTIDIGNHAADPTVSVNAIGRWVFNEGSGTSTTDAYNSNTGTLTNLNTANGGTAPTWVTGHNGSSGTALSFDGKGGVVSVPLADTAVLDTTSTLSVWFQTTQVGSTIGWSSPSIIGSEHQGDANDIQWGAINNLGEIGLGLGNDPTGVYSTAAVNDGKWHDLTITRTVNADGSSLVSVYVDGVLSNSATLAAQSPASNGIPTNFLAGFGYTNGWQTTGTGASAVNSDGTAGDVYYKGSLDDAAIYSHALTADQAKAVYLVENGFEGQAVANVGDPIKLTVTDTNATALHVIGVENGMTLTDGTHTITSTGNSQVIDVTGWNLTALQLTNVGTGSATLEFDAINTNANGQTEDTSTYLSVVNGTSLLAGTAGNDTLNASANTGATFISGGAGNDVITGGSGNDHLIGGSGKDTISGGAGNDLIDPGSGSATLTGGAGNDVFHWELADHGTAGTPSVVTITDFSSVTGNKDMLDLRDLLPGANHDGTQAGNIANYLHFDLEGGDTVIHVSTTGGFAGGYSAAVENETIILKGVDLTSASSQTDSQIIHQLLANGQLHLG